VNPAARHGTLRQGRLTENASGNHGNDGTIKLCGRTHRYRNDGRTAGRHHPVRVSLQLENFGSVFWPPQERAQSSSISQGAA